MNRTKRIEGGLLLRSSGYSEMPLTPARDMIFSEKAVLMLCLWDTSWGTTLKK